MNRKSALFIATLLMAVAAPFAVTADTPHTSQPLSLLHVRIVRLSFVNGDVAIKRPDETDWTAGTVNTPIEEGFSVATSANSFAEVEFENGSTARIGQGSQVNFTQLALTQQGDKINKLELSKGYATFRFTPAHHDQYEVDASGVALTIHGKAEFRTNLENDSLHVEVFEGDVQTAHDGKTEDVGKNRVLTYDPNATEAAVLGSGFQRDSWDKWTQARDQQSAAAMNDESFSLNSPVFGWADLDTYGDWGYFPGYGYAWSPYEPAGWSPYSAGMWGNYPGWGFTWISAEPWGWLPFHNGFWNYDASMGWFWIPGPLDAWSPALVNWYQGDGWVGWAPIGTGGGACVVTTVGCITAVPPTAISGGTPIRPTSPIVVHPTIRSGVTRISTPHLASGMPNPGTRVAVHSAVAANAGIHAAPMNVVMGHDMTPDAFLSHHGFFSGQQAIHAPMGRTMGGMFPTVTARNGQLSPDPKFHPPASIASGSAPGMAAARNNAGPEPVHAPVVMPHGGAAGGGATASISERGGITPAASAGSGAAAGFSQPNGATGTAGNVSAAQPSAVSAPAPMPSSSAASGGGARSAPSMGSGGGRR